MKNSWNIYKNDLQRVFIVPKIALLVIGIMILPSIYAWVNIEANWDPYGNTSGIKVAVVNEDEGANVNEVALNVGNQTVENLKNNEKLGWVFVDREKAERGVTYGDYYAYLIIPSDFSEKLASIVKNNPQRPVILYGVNEKINGIVPKIATSGATGITGEISKSFTEAVGVQIFSKFNTIGNDLEQSLPLIEKAETGVLELEEMLPRIHELGTVAIDLEEKLPTIREKVQKVIDMEQRIPDLERAGENILKLESALPVIDEMGERVLALNEKLASLQRIITVIGEVEEHLGDIENKIKQGVESSQTAARVQVIPTDKLEVLQRLHSELLAIHQNIQSLRESLRQKVTEGITGINKAADFVQNDLPTVENKIHRAADFVRNDLPQLEKDIQKASTVLKTNLPLFEDAVHKAADLVRNQLPTFEEKVKNAADKVRSIQQNVDLPGVIELLKHDPLKAASFLANPIELETKRIFPIPNYGAAMAPLYSLLALWVGGTVIVTALPVDAKNLYQQYASHELYLGRLFTFLTIGLLQAIIMTVGNLFLLHVYIVAKWAYVFFSIFIGAVFITIIYTLRTVFGNIGNALSLIFLVFQMSSSGITFPVSMQTSFFQKISPFMPFTHGVGMLREAIGGLLKEGVIPHIFPLVLYAVGFIVMGLVLKRAFSKEVVLDAADGE